MENPKKVRFVVATRESEIEFFTKTATGRSLKLYNGLGFELDLYASNSSGLPQVYNQSIDKAKNDPAILVFSHDDVHITDYWWIKKIRECIKYFHITGIVGNTRRTDFQPTWCHKDINMTYDDGYMSGAIANGNSFPPELLCVYGPTPHEVKLMDGVFMICDSETLINHNIRFDEQFDFNFYDLDLCRQAEQKGLKMGTWEISLIHESGGKDSPSWRDSLEKYYRKWGS